MGRVNGIEFGTFWWRNPNRPLIDYEKSEEHVFEEAIAHACPVTKKVVEKFGAEWALERYTTCNVAMEKLLLETAERLNPKLLGLLLAPVPREEGEPVGVYQEGCVPESHEREMSFGSTAYGFSLPRVIIEAMGRDENGRLALNYDRLPAIMEMIEEVVKVSQDPYELLARIAKGAVENGADRQKVLDHIFDGGIIKEENCHIQMEKIVAALRTFAPEFLVSD